MSAYSNLFFFNYSMSDMKCVLQVLKHMLNFKRLNCPIKTHGTAHVHHAKDVCKVLQVCGLQVRTSNSLLFKE